jgi:hypothetical protein
LQLSCLQRPHHRNPCHHGEAAAFLNGSHEALRRKLPVRQDNFLL